MMHELIVLPAALVAVMLVDSVIVVGCECLPVGEEGGARQKHLLRHFVRAQNCLLVIIIPAPAVAVMLG